VRYAVSSPGLCLGFPAIAKAKHPIAVHRALCELRCKWGELRIWRRQSCLASLLSLQGDNPAIRCLFAPALVLALDPKLATRCSMWMISDGQMTVETRDSHISTPRVRGREGQNEAVLPGIRFVLSCSANCGDTTPSVRWPGQLAARQLTYKG
jgi:hypothetical protein